MLKLFGREGFCEGVDEAIILLFFVVLLFSASDF